MGQDRRTFIRNLSLLSLGSLSLPHWDQGLQAEITQALADLQALPPQEAALNEDIWAMVRRSFDHPSDFINLENGYFSPMPLPVLDVFLRESRRINHLSSHYMRREQDADKERIRKKLAAFAGLDPEELAFTRNTTESLDILISGLPLQKGDEVIVSRYDYGSMLEAFAQLAERKGVRIVEVDLPLVPQSKAELIQPYAEAITAATRAMLVTQLINLNGTILPVRELCQLGKDRGIEVIVDGAHAFAHLDQKVGELGCDYYGTSLHKWLSAPLGNGLLHVRKNKITPIWPLMGDTEKAKDDIRKFEHQGTRPPAAWLSIEAAIDFHQQIGSARKQARLHYLKEYWASQAAEIPKVSLNTSLSPEFSSAIAHVSIQGIPPVELMDRLIRDYGIFTVAVVRGPLSGVRITPHLYNSLQDLDALLQALREIAKA